MRVACTPYKGAIRVSDNTEFRHPHDRVIPERVEAIVASASPLLDGVRWDERSNEWVGAHPVTPDGHPLIGEVSRGVYVAGGHGRWGLAWRPGDRSAVGRTGHHRQATPSPVRVRCTAQKRPLALPIPAGLNRSANFARRGPRVVRGGCPFWAAPDDTPLDTKRTPTKMTSIQRIRMTRQDYTELHNELAALRSRRSIEVPDD